jgi:hypothetical protein
MDYYKILTCKTIIGNQGGRQDVGKEALGERDEKKRERHTTLLCVLQNRVSLLFSLSRVKGF